MDYIKYSPWITGTFVFIIYLFTMAPSVIQIDSGELAAVQILPGIAHPTGYPLFTILGYFWSLIPLPISGIYQMNLLASLLCSAGIILFIKIVYFILDNPEKFKSTKKQKAKQKGKKKEKVIKEETVSSNYNHFIFTAIPSALFLAFSKTFWFQSTSVEVYSLHIALILLIIYTLLKAYAEGSDRIYNRHWLIFSATLALGFTNHMTTLLVLPGVAYLYFNKYGFNALSLKRLGVMILLFSAILVIIYAYLPLRASTDPLLNWGNPVDFERILRHISGKQYQVWLFSSTESAKKQLEFFFLNLPSEFGFTLLVSLAGIFFSAVYAKRIFIFLLISFITTVIYSINYDISDIDSYFLLAYITLAFFSVFALLRAFNYFYPARKGYRTIFFAAVILIALQVYQNYKEVDQSGNYVFEDYTKSLVNSVPENAIIFSYQWDYFISPAYYFQYVEDFRRDVTIVDKELLRRSWYYKQLATNYPDLFTGVKTDINLFLNALQPFERSENYNAALLENLFRRIMTGLVSANIEKRAFYVAPELVEGEMQRGEFTLPTGYTLVPDLFLYKVVKGKEYVPAADPDYFIRFPGTENRYSGFIKNRTGSMLMSRAMYEMQFDRMDRAKLYIDKIKKDIPEFRLPPELAKVFK